MSRGLNEFDTFKLLVRENIELNDYQLIFMLYQPLIGGQATNLYLTLLQEKQLTNRINLDFNHSRLMILLGIDKFELLNAFKLLEAHDLITTYFYPLKATYIYDIKRPLPAELFFQSEKFCPELLRKIGSLQFERQKYYFLKTEPEITNNFINISHEGFLATDNNAHYDQNQNFLQQLLTNLNTNVKDSEPQLPNNFLNQTSKPAPNWQAKANLATETNANISSNQKLYDQTLDLMKNNTPETYLNHLTNKPLDLRLKITLNVLANDLKLNNETINCILEYVWFKNNKRLEPNYIIKIANTFKDNSINNIGDALKHLKLAYSKSKKNPTNYNNYQQDVLWTSDHFNLEIGNNSQNKPKNYPNDGKMSQEEIRKILEEFDNY